MPHISNKETAMEVFLARIKSPARLRRFAPARETGKERTEGKANAIPDRGQL